MSSDLHVVFERRYVDLISKAMRLMLYRVDSKLVEKCSSTHQAASTAHCLSHSDND